VSVIDPDGSKNQYGYDNRHQVTSHTDKTGQVKTGTYDEFGRAKTATREDGSIVQINPDQVQGLLSKQQTTNLDDIIAVEKLSANSVSTYIDANGRVTSTTLNDSGHALARIDEIGVRERKTYNDQDLVTSRTDGRGNTIKYEYDERGNVIKTSEQIAGATQENTDGNLFGNSIKKITQTGREFLNISGGGYSPTVFADAARVIGDIDNDGFNDIIARNSNQTYNILMGDADGLFATRSSIPADAFGQINTINQLDLKDVDSDGDLDLIANLPIDGGSYGNASASLLQDPVLVYLNQGNGQFGSPQVLPLQAISDGFVTGDFNGDGKLDIVVRSDIYSARLNNVYPVVLYTGNGRGNWSKSDINIAGIDANSSFVGGLQMSAIDVDKDGRTELVFNQPGGLSIYKYVNPCVWLKTDSYATDFNTSRARMTVGDVNHDGLTDIVTIGAKEMNIFLGQKNGSFQVKQVNPFDNDLVFEPNHSKLQIVDVDGDGRSDLAVFGRDTNYRQSVKFYSFNAAEDVIQLGNATKVNYYNLINGVESYTRIDRLADINGDGTAELLLSVQNRVTGGYDLGVIDNRSVLRETITLTKSYAYDSKFNKLTSATDELGRKTLYDLDSNTGNILKTTRVVGQLDTISGETNDVITSYTYTSTGQVDLVTDALLHITDYDYDIRGNLTKTTSAKGTLDQTVEQYEYDLAGNRTASIDALDRKTKYVYNSTNMLLQTIDARGGTTTYNYDKMGHQTKVTDALGHVTSMTYDSRGRLVSTSDASGSTTTDTYDNNGNLLAVTDALGRVTQYQYDARNRLIGTISADGGTNTTKYDLNDNLTGHKDSLGHTTQKFYDSRNRLNREVDALGNETKYSYDAVNQLIATTDGKGHTTTYRYDELGRQISTTDALGSVTRTEYDKLGGVTASIDANGNRTTYTYDALNRRTQVKDAQNSLTKTGYDKVGNVLSVTDALNRITSYAYDALNRQVSVTDALGHTSTTAYNAVGDVVTTTDALSRTTSYTYDNLNRRIATSDALGQTQSITYDLIGNVLTATDKLGRITSYGYDKLDRLTVTTDPLLHTTSTSYDTEGNILSTTDALGHKTSYLYDNNNWRIQVIDAASGITKTSYDSVGNVISTTNALNHTTNYGYDAIDRRIGTTDALNQTNTTSYDAVGNTIAYTDRLGRTTTSSYDNLNRRISTTDVLGQTKSVTYDEVSRVLNSTNELGQITSYGYDLLDRKTSITDALGNTSTTSYDAVGNITITTDEIGNSTRYIYDNLNRRVQTIDAKGGVSKTSFNAVGNVEKITDSVNNSTSYTYDAANRLTAETNQLGKTRTHNYDAVGNQIDTIDRNGRKIAYNYDVLNRQTTENWLDDNNATIKTFAYIYDAVGHLLTSTNPDSKYTYTYDAIDRLTSIENTGTVGVPAVKFDYNYDAVGNIIAVTDRINNINAGITTYTYDLLNRVTQLTQSGNGVQTKQVSMVYNALDRITNLTRYSGNSNVAATNYLYDNNQRLIKLTHQKGANTIANYDYTYDAADKLNKTVSSSDGTSDYSYDATNQLTGTDNSVQTDEAYSYDANGNRTTGGYQTGVNNQLLADGRYNYEYDGEGNRTKRTEIATGKVTEYIWDYRNRLTSVLFKDTGGTVSKTIEYIYDGNNQRIGKRIDGAVVERYVIDRNQIALVFNGAGVQTHRYLYGTAVDQVLADETATSMVWALADNQGTIKDLVDNNGVVVKHVTYDSFGQVVAQSTTGVDFRYGYTGREQDSETGLDYYRARYYDSANGRFISEDPLGFGAGDGNLTRYVGNSPTNGTDPSGLSAEALKDFLVSLGLRTLTLPFNKATYTNGQPIGYPLGILGWRSLFQIADFLSPTQNFTKFLDYYFADGSSRKPFVLEREGILESIKSISTIRTATNEFNQRMQRAINAKIRDLQNESTCPTNQTIAFKIDRDLFVNLTKNGNFALGQTRINAIGKVNMLKQGNGNVSVINARIDYKLIDDFNDAIDTFNWTNPEDVINIRDTDITILSLREELIGGVGYPIEGNWSTGIGNYRRN
jgi:RHS repeat-associated protein